MRHETPQLIAKLLARHAPRLVRSVLDPAAGSGILVEPFLRKAKLRKIECVDIDEKATAALRQRFINIKNVRIHRANFLNWQTSQENQRTRRFDCIVMNPPFSARKETFVELSVQDKERERTLKVPIEAAFVFRAIHMLRPGGRLLAILPSSVVSAQGTLWLRQLMMRYGSIRLVHELPYRTFRGVEGHIYIVVYEKGQPQSALAARNHRLFKSEEIRIPKKQVINAERLDYRYYDASLWYARARQSADLDWRLLEDVAFVFRGAVDSPITDDTVLHTTNFFSFRTIQEVSTRSKSEAHARPGDLVIKRVARRCAESVIAFPGHVPARCSDCVLVIRPKVGFDSKKVLFAIRTVLAWRLGAALVEHGVGATYIPANCLRSLAIPIDLADRYLKSFQKFAITVDHCRWSELYKIENFVRACISRKTGSCK